MAMRQRFWTKALVLAAGPFRKSHIAKAAAKRKGQEGIQLFLESIYSPQRNLPSHGIMASCPTLRVRAIPHVFTAALPPSARSLLSAVADTFGLVRASAPSIPEVLARWVSPPCRSSS